MPRRSSHRTAEKSTLGIQLKALGQVAAEHRFHPTRRWLFDFAFVQEKVAVEFEGGVWMKPGTGAHNRPANIIRDIDKYNAAQLLGWLIIRVTRDSVRSGDAFDLVHQALKLRRGSGLHTA